MAIKSIDHLNFEFFFLENYAKYEKVAREEKVVFGVALLN